ncbi:MAG: GTPase domain-containing protein [Acidobacteriota bacterium]
MNAKTSLPSDAPADAPSQITLSLVSHTNVGKTTLARTLLRRDIGEVLDQAHVTEDPEVFVLVEGERGELRLWDTPGFGDSARLLRRLRRSERPVLWLLQQTWDRIADRPFWSSQQAALNVREQADVVLYLVNASEDPEAAGYVDLELELLDWLKVPVLVVLNQTGVLGERAELLADATDRWRRHVERFASVGGVLPLDAFSRCWVQETRLLRRVEELLDDGQRPLMAHLRGVWEARHLETFARAVEAVTSYLERTARDRATLASKRPSREEKQDGMEALGQRLVHATEELMTALLAAYELEGQAGAEIDRQIHAFAVEGEEQLDTERGALLGGVVSGAVGGLAADLLAGGLTFGGGMLAGAILGALGGAGLARGVQLLRGDRLPEVAWTPPFLERLFEQATLRYLAVAHFGRGRGEFRHEESSQRWRELVANELRRERDERLDLWRSFADPKRGAFAADLRRQVDRVLRRVLARAYPEAARLLDVDPKHLV